jgi:hypothetical protein
LLQRIPDAHPDLAICRESFWIPYFFKKRIGLTPEGLVTPELISRLLEYYKFYRMKVGRDELAGLIRCGEPVAYSSFVSGLFDLYGEIHGKPLAGDKTPDFDRNLSTLHALWPEAKFIHLGVEEVLRYVLDRDAGKIGARLATGVQGVLLFQVRFQGSIGIGPHAEVVHPTTDFLGPLAAGMGEQREVGIGLARLDGWTRMRIGHSNSSSNRCCGVHGRERYHRPGLVIRDRASGVVKGVVEE